MDTAFVVHPDCSPPYAIFYYSVKAKYPVSSSVLRDKVRDYMEGKNVVSNASGYLTFRFFIDCKGTMSRVRVFQTDENYETIHFPKDYVDGLYQFIKTIDQWPQGIDYSGLKQVNYLAFITFKIRDGKIDNIIP